MTTKKKTFVQGAVILGVAGILAKVLGAVFRIPLNNIILDSGIGYYTSAYPIYVMFLTLSTAGIPVAISRLVAEANADNNPREAHRVFRLSFFLMAIIGVVTSAILFFGADWISEIINPGDTGIRYSLMAIAPALLLVPIMAAYRGYFQGMQNMAPTAVSQVVEQFFRVLVGLALAILLVPDAVSLLLEANEGLLAIAERLGAAVDYVSYSADNLVFGILPKGLKFAAAGASFGATAGSIFGLITIVLIYRGHKDRIMENLKRSPKKGGAPVASILGKIFIIAVPITIGASIMPIINTMDVLTVMRRLQEIGYTEEAARTLYGQLTGIATSLINLPQVLTQAVAMSLVPVVATAFKKKDMPFLRHNVELSLRFATVIGMPCSLGLIILSEPIMLMLYRVDRASAIGQAQCLFVLGMGVVFLASVQISAGILQGIGKQMIPVRNLFIGAVVKLFMTYTLTVIPSINVKGAAMGTVAAYVIASSLNLIAVRKYTGLRFNASLIWIKPFVSAVVMGGCAWLTYRLTAGILGNTVSTMLAVMIGGIVYVVMIFVTRTITEEELAALPKGDKLAGVVRKFKRG